MPARKITINGVSNSFEWQVGNTTRFIRFEDITEFNDEVGTVFIGNTICQVPANELERFKTEYTGWRKQR